MSEDRLHERWREPVIPLAIRDDYDTISLDAGRPTLDVQMRFKPSDIERIRLGYVCIDCLEPHEHAFPESCGLCGFPMREFQREDFDRKFKGLERDPRAVTIEAGLNRVDDNHERNFYELKNGIVVPRTVKGS